MDSEAVDLECPTCSNDLVDPLVLHQEAKAVHLLQAAAPMKENLQVYRQASHRRGISNLRDEPAFPKN